MGYAMCVSTCFGCGRVFSFNPNRVPSIRVEGVRRPICKECVEYANPRRITNGLEPIKIHPQAYEAIHESELGEAND